MNGVDFYVFTWGFNVWHNWIFIFHRNCGSNSKLFLFTFFRFFSRWYKNAIITIVIVIFGLKCNFYFYDNATCLDFHSNRSGWSGSMIWEISDDVRGRVGHKINPKKQRTPLENVRSCETKVYTYIFFRNLGFFCIHNEKQFHDIVICMRNADFFFESYVSHGWKSHKFAKYKRIVLLQVKAWKLMEWNEFLVDNLDANRMKNFVESFG